MVVLAFDDAARGARVDRGDASAQAVVGAGDGLRQPGRADVGHPLPLEFALLRHHVGAFAVDEQDAAVGGDLEPGGQLIGENVLVQPLRALVLEVCRIDDHPRRGGGVGEHRVGEHVADHLVHHAGDVLGLDAGAPDQARGFDVLVCGGRARRVLDARRRGAGAAGVDDDGGRDRSVASPVRPVGRTTRADSRVMPRSAGRRRPRS